MDTHNGFTGVVAETPQDRMGAYRAALLGEGDGGADWERLVLAAVNADNAAGNPPDAEAVANARAALIYECGLNTPCARCGDAGMDAYKGVAPCVAAEAAVNAAAGGAKPGHCCAVCFGTDNLRLAYVCADCVD